MISHFIQILKLKFCIISLRFCRSFSQGWMEQPGAATATHQRFSYRQVDFDQSIDRT
jgi:hypothetical protein